MVEKSLVVACSLQSQGVRHVSEAEASIKDVSDGVRMSKGDTVDDSILP